MNATEPTVESFLSALKKSGLVSSASLTEARNDFRQLASSQSVESFSEFLIERGLITSWQGVKLLKGKYRGFFLGKYKLLTLLGRGGMSTVYLAEHTVMKRNCALKVLPHKLVRDSTYLERFHREAQAVAALDHPNIVRAYDVDVEVDGQLEIHFLVMEFIQGHNFFELVKGLGPCEVATAADYIHQASLGLQHAHDAGMIHRDIKPGNFLLDRTGVVKMMDLGLARSFLKQEEFSLTLVNDEKIMGTADYLAPEQAIDSHHIDTRADIYGLGCTFYYLLTGRPPYDEGTLTQRLLAHQTKTPKPISSYRDDVPQPISALIGQMMEKDPNKRVQTAREVAERLEKWLESNESESTESHSDPRLELPSVESLLTGPPSMIPEQTGELIDFLSRLDSDIVSDHSTKKSSVTKQSLPSPPSGGQRTSDIHVTADSAKEITTSSDSLRGSSRRASRLKHPLANKKQRLILTIIGVAVVAVGVWALIWANRPGETRPIKNQQASNSSSVVESPVPMRNLPGPVVTVGKTGDFQTLSAAVEYLLHPDVPASKFTEVQILAGAEIDDEIVIDHSGLKRLPDGFRITGQGPDFPVISGNHETLITLRSVENLTISNLILDASQCTQALTIEGYATGSVLRDVTIENIAQRGITGHGLSGLPRKPFSIEKCRFDPSGTAECAICFESVDPGELVVSGTRQILINRCQFLGQFPAAIRLSEFTSDFDVQRSVFYQAQTGILFDGQMQDITRATFSNNTFYKCQRGVAFDTGPIEACSALTFVRNLFIDVSDGEVITQRQNVSIEELSAGATPPKLNWSTSSPSDSEHWLDIFALQGRTDVAGVAFSSTDPTSNKFLKPVSSELDLTTENAFRGIRFIGAIAP